MALTIDQVMEEYGYYVESVLLQYGVSPNEFEDLKQEVWLRVHACDLLGSHDPAGAAKFSTRLWYVIRAVAIWHKDRVAAKDRSKVDQLSEGVARRVSDEGRAAQEILIRVRINDLEAHLDARARTVLTLVREGFRAPYIATVIQQSEQTVRNILKRIQAEAAVA